MSKCCEYSNAGRVFPAKIDMMARLGWAVESPSLPVLPVALQLSHHKEMQNLSRQPLKYAPLCHVLKTKPCINEKLCENLKVKGQYA